MCNTSTCTVHISNVYKRILRSSLLVAREYQSTLSMLVTSMLSCMTGMLTPNFTLYGLCQIRPIPDAPGCPTYHQIQTWKGQGKGNTWSWVDILIMLPASLFTHFCAVPRQMWNKNCKKYNIRHLFCNKALLRNIHF